MKIHITVTDPNGAVFEGDADLAQAAVAGRRNGRPAESAPAAKRASNRKATPTLDFGVNERAFMKAHAEGLGGPKRFVLMLAYLSKGHVGKEVELGDVQKRWNKMKTLLGNFNRKYTNDAKESGWVDTRKKGVYVLTSSWKEALS